MKTWNARKRQLTPNNESVPSRIMRKTDRRATFGHTASRLVKVPKKEYKTI